MVPFECQICIFRKLRLSEPDMSSPTDTLLLSVLIRANLDTFWSSQTGTVAQHVGKLKAGIGFSDRLGLKGPYQQKGHLPPYDHCGYEVACQLLLKMTKDTRSGTPYES